MKTARVMPSILLCAALAATAVAPIAAMAHEFHNLLRLDARIGSAAMGAEGALVELTLTNLRDTPVSLDAVYSDLGVVSARLPLDLAPGQTINAELLVATADLPGIFTLVLDFGQDGQGPVLVIPDQAQSATAHLVQN